MGTTDQMLIQSLITRAIPSTLALGIHNVGLLLGNNKAGRTVNTVANFLNSMKDVPT